MNRVQRGILIVAGLLLLLFAFTVATTYNGDAGLATFQFLAAVGCLYAAVKTGKPTKAD